MNEEKETVRGHARPPLALNLPIVSSAFAAVAVADTPRRA